MLSDRWRTWREANPQDARRLLRASAVSVLVALVVLMLFYPHGLYVVGVVTAVTVVIALLYADWRV